MKSIITLSACFVILCVTSIAQSAIDATIFHQEKEDGYTLYAKNMEYCPVTITFINLSLDNLRSSVGTKRTFTIPPRKSKFLLMKLTEIDNKKGYKYAYKKYVYHMGDPASTPDASYQYHLPYPKGNSYLISQGYQGTFSHHGTNALDFDMKKGSIITAMRAGVVVKVVERYNKGGTKESYKDRANYILIYHKDGTFAQYVHLKKYGASVKVGDRVKKGQSIGFSGNTGYSSGPHLHVEVYKPKKDGKKETLKTKFLVSNGKITYLQANKRYK